MVLVVLILEFAGLALWMFGEAKRPTAAAGIMCWFFAAFMAAALGAVLASLVALAVVIFWTKVWFANNR